jgi:hypothetical protein
MFTSISRQCRDKDLVDEDHVGPCTARSGAFAESRLHSSIVKEQLRMSKPGEPLTAFTAQGHMGPTRESSSLSSNALSVKRSSEAMVGQFDRKASTRA